MDEGRIGLYTCSQHIDGIPDGKRHFAYCVLRMAYCGWRIADGVLRIAFCGWRFADGVLRIAFCGWRFADGVLRIA